MKLYQASIESPHTKGKYGTLTSVDAKARPKLCC